MDSKSRSNVKRIFVLHWQPLEQYPPTKNLLNCFSSFPDCSVAVCSAHNDRCLVEYTNPSVLFSRMRFPNRRLSRFRRLFAFLQFPLLALWKMIRFRPDIVLYIEPHSSFPATLFGLINYRHRLFIHYHEYYEPEHFHAPGMRLVASYHWFEKRYLYRRAAWISQTNADRVRMFCEDHPHVNRAKLHVLPNLPPASWRKLTELTWISRPQDTLRLLYVGSVSLHDTFIAELVEWLQPRRVLHELRPGCTGFPEPVCRTKSPVSLRRNPVRQTAGCLAGIPRRPDPVPREYQELHL